MRAILLALPLALSLAACQNNSGPDPDTFYDQQQMVFTMQDGSRYLQAGQSWYVQTGNQWASSAAPTDDQLNHSTSNTETVAMLGGTTPYTQSQLDQLQAQQDADSDDSDDDSQ
jgi:hypothetical protein